MTLSKNQTTGVLKISGTLDIEAANALREAFLDCLLQQPEPVADLSAVDGCDAAALQVLLAGRKHAAAAGKALRFLATSDAVIDAAAALGFRIDEPGGDGSSEHPHAK
jgi:anti-anti-sigma factor